MKRNSLWRDETGAVPIIVIYAILLAMLLGGMSGLTVYLASDSVGSLLLAVALALIVIFSIPVLPGIINGIVGTRKALTKWAADMKKELKQ